MKALKFTTMQLEDGPHIVYDVAKCAPELWTEQREWHFVELPPGHIVVSRERLREAIAKATWENKSRDVDQICEVALERELFGHK